MHSQELRQKFLKFFEGKDHKIIPSSSLIPEGDSSVLLTTAGMQQFKPYFAGTKDPTEDFGNKNLVSVQKCFRTSDIDSVGDESHLTFFEMLGNFSIGGYGKKEAIEYTWELMTSKEWYGLPKDKFFATVFAGDDEIPADEDSEKYWKAVSPNIEVKKLAREDNFWPNPVWIGTCGPSSELHYILNDESSIEVWNLVFTQYFHNKDGSFKDLGQINIDTGMGLERLAMVTQNKISVFETDLFQALYNEIIVVVDKNIQDSTKPEFTKITDVRKQRIKIFLDHSRATFFLIADGVFPGKNEKESVLRRLIRKANDQLSILGLKSVETWWNKSIQHYREIYKNSYRFTEDSLDIIKDELAKYGEVFSSSEFEKLAVKITTDEDINKSVLTYNLEKYSQPDFTSFMHKHSFESLPSVTAGTIAFDAKSTLGVPPENTLEIAKQKLGLDLRINEFSGTINILSKEHQERSKGIEAGKFKGGLAGHSETEIQYHTATHLLHQALRDVLGPQVFQKGSNITSERLRFDFAYDKKMTDEEIKKVEDLINERIKQDLKVDHMTVTLEDAKKMNAIGLFDEKYAENVSIYGVGPGFSLDPQALDRRERGGYYSLEFCGGPHVDTTGAIGKIKITREEAVSSGMRRIRAF